MGRWVRLARVSLILGLAIAFIALLADPLGLDRAGGWGRARIATLAFGIFAAAIALLHLRYGDLLARALARLRAGVRDLPILQRLNEHGALSRLGESLQRNLPDATLLCAVLVFYLWFASSGHWNRIPSSTYHYQLLASGFEQGRLSLPIERNASSDLPRDISRFERQYYLYWGPVPALILLALKPLTHGRIADSSLALGFVSGTFLVQYVLLKGMWGRHFGKLPVWTLRTVILLVGLAGPALFLRHNYDTAKVYEAAINAGQFFLMAGVLVLISSWQGRAVRPWHVAAAGTFWALALASRLTLAVPIALLGAVILFWSVRVQNSWAARASLLASLAIPLLLGLASLGWYNWARFGSITETGFSYQLAPVLRRNDYQEIWDVRYVLPNIYNYLLNPPSLTPSFPFLQLARGYEPSADSILAVPEFYNAQPITGLLWFVPFALFAIPGAAALRLTVRNRTVDGRVHDGSVALPWTSLALSSIILGSFAFNTTYFWAGMRFTGDFLPSLSALAAIGFWEACRAQQARPALPRALTAASLGLIALSGGASFLLALSTNSGLLR